MLCWVVNEVSVFEEQLPERNATRAVLRGDWIKYSEDSQIKPSSCRLLRELYGSCAASGEKTEKT